MRRVIAIRPEPGLAATLAAGRAAGLDMKGFALFEVRPVPWIAPDAQEIDGLLIGSANAIRHAGPQLENFRNKPLYAVGEATAGCARDAGFAVAFTGSGGLQQVVDALAGSRLHLLRLSAREHVPVDPPAGISLSTRIVYEAASLPMPPSLAVELEDGPVVLLHSAEAARHFASECDRLAIDRSRIRIAAMGKRIAKAAGGGWEECRPASMTTEAAVLALARDMCH